MFDDGPLQFLDELGRSTCIKSGRSVGYLISS